MKHKPPHPASGVLLKELTPLYNPFIHARRAGLSGWGGENLHAFICGLWCFFLIMLIPIPSRAGSGYPPVDVSKLKFESKADEALYSSLRGCLLEKNKDGSMLYAKPHEVGNFVKEAWAKGQGADPISINGYFTSQRGSSWYDLSTIFYKLPDAFGISFSAGNMPQNSPWGVSFFYSRNGKGVLGEGLGVTFCKIDDSNPPKMVSLGDGYSYDAGATTVYFTAPEGRDVELKKYLKSEESFKNTFVSRQKSLLKRVIGTIKTHKAQKIVYGPYEGGGIPPVETFVKMTQKEENEELTKAQKEINENIKIVNQNYKLFYLLLTGLIDFNRCWK